MNPRIVSLLAALAFLAAPLAALPVQADPVQDAQGAAQQAQDCLAQEPPTAPMGCFEGLLNGALEGPSTGDNGYTILEAEMGLAPGEGIDGSQAVEMALPGATPHGGNYLGNLEAAAVPGVLLQQVDHVSFQYRIPEAIPSSVYPNFQLYLDLDTNGDGGRDLCLATWPYNTMLPETDAWTLFAAGRPDPAASDVQHALGMTNAGDSGCGPLTCVPGAGCDPVAYQTERESSLASHSASTAAQSNPMAAARVLAVHLELTVAQDTVWPEGTPLYVDELSLGLATPAAAVEPALPPEACDALDQNGPAIGPGWDCAGFQRAIDHVAAGDWYVEAIVNGAHFYAGPGARAANGDVPFGQNAPASTDNRIFLTNSQDAIDAIQSFNPFDGETLRIPGDDGYIIDVDATPAPGVGCEGASILGLDGTSVCENSIDENPGSLAATQVLIRLPPAVVEATGICELHVKEAGEDGTDPFYHLYSDLDDDGVTDVDELGATDPPRDPLRNEDDPCVAGAAPDADRDGLPDSEEDQDGDGFLDDGETEPGRPDTDFDGLTDCQETGFVPGSGDPDGPGPAAPGEDLGSARDCGDLRTFHTDPRAPDTDSDFFNDGAEVVAGTDPTDAGSRPGVSPPGSLGDLDLDGLPDSEEDVDGDGEVDDGETDPRQPDTDNDGLTDCQESGFTARGTAPNNPPASTAQGDPYLTGEDTGSGRECPDPLDPSGAALTTFHTSPTDADSDEDTVSDGDEAFGLYALAGPCPVTNSGGAYRTARGSVSPALLQALAGLPIVGDLAGNLLGDLALQLLRENLDTDCSGIATNPTTTDTDGDGLSDRQEVGPGGTATGDQSTSDPTVADYDGDGLDDSEEQARGTQDDDADSDNDGLTDCEETGLVANSDPYKQASAACPDPDGTGPLGSGFLYDTKPDEDDSDGDGIPDGAEDSESETNPTDDDSDNDGLKDGTEDASPYGDIPASESDPNDADTDDDGLSDGTEDKSKDGNLGNDESDPNDADTDGDGIDDNLEPDQNSDGAADALWDRRDTDSDQDGIQDGVEDGNQNGARDPLETDPRDPDTDNDGLCDGNVGTATRTNPGGNPATCTQGEDRNGDGDLGTDPGESNPLSGDSDGDGLTDTEEDKDRDGVLDNDESSPTDTDTDDDGITDNLEPNQNSDGAADALWDRRDTDSDQDGIQDGTEDFDHNGQKPATETDPRDPDTDNDGLCDGLVASGTLPNPGGNPATCTGGEDRDASRTMGPAETDPLDFDTDDDSIEDGPEDTDGDGALDSGESNPRDPDTDGDGICDGARADNEAPANGVDPTDPCTSGEDRDADGTVDTGASAETNPSDADSDDDGLDDKVEDKDADHVLEDGETDPLDSDTDDDGRSDGLEDADHSGGVTTGETDPRDPDTDGDGLNDGPETTYTTDPLDPDTDDDGLADGAEDADQSGGQNGPEPNAKDADSDDDTLSDCREVAVADDTTMLVPEAEDYVADPSATACPDPDGAGPLAGGAKYKTSPLRADSDRDGELPDPLLATAQSRDDQEIAAGTNPTKADSDGDGIADPYEDDADTDAKCAMVDDAYGDCQELALFGPTLVAGALLNTLRFPDPGAVGEEPGPGACDFRSVSSWGRPTLPIVGGDYGGTVTRSPDDFASNGLIDWQDSNGNWLLWDGDACHDIGDPGDDTETAGEPKPGEDTVYEQHLFNYILRVLQAQELPCGLEEPDPNAEPAPPEPDCDEDKEELLAFLEQALGDAYAGTAGRLDLRDPEDVDEDGVTEEPNGQVDRLEEEYLLIDPHGALPTFAVNQVDDDGPSEGDGLTAALPDDRTGATVILRDPVAHNVLLILSVYLPPGLDPAVVGPPAGPAPVAIAEAAGASGMQTVCVAAGVPGGVDSAAESLPRVVGPTPGRYGGDCGGSAGPDLYAEFDIEGAQLVAPAEPVSLPEAYVLKVAAEPFAVEVHPWERLADGWAPLADGRPVYLYIERECGPFGEDGGEARMGLPCENEDGAADFAVAGLPMQWDADEGHYVATVDPASFPEDFLVDGRFAFAKVYVNAETRGALLGANYNAHTDAAWDPHHTDSDPTEGLATTAFLDALDDVADGRFTPVAFTADPGGMNPADRDGDLNPDIGVDGVLPADNCPDNPHTGGQDADPDGDGKGNDCDTDDDNDGVPDTADNCATVFNGNQDNYDSDLEGDECDQDDDNDLRNDAAPDACAQGDLGWQSSPQTDFDSDGCRDAGEDLDDDSDGLPDLQEAGRGASTTDPDSDDDGWTDCQETGYVAGSSPYKHGTATSCPDPDGGGSLTGGFLFHTSAASIDSDADGIKDRVEDVTSHTNPADSDSDDDGVADGTEDANDNGNLDTGETGANDPDSDDDGWTDCQETGYVAGSVPYKHGTATSCPDPDGGGALTGGFQFRTNPRDTDSDDDGIDDRVEDVTSHTNPTDADSDDDSIEDGTEDQAPFGAGDGETDPNDPDTDADGRCDGPRADNEVPANGLDPSDLCTSGETTTGTSPTDPDSDNDGFLDGPDKCPLLGDDQADTDGDGVGDACDNEDGDGLLAGFILPTAAKALLPVMPYDGSAFTVTVSAMKKVDNDWVSYTDSLDLFIQRGCGPLDDDVQGGEPGNTVGSVLPGGCQSLDDAVYAGRAQLVGGSYTFTVPAGALDGAFGYTVDANGMPVQADDVAALRFVVGSTDSTPRYSSYFLPKEALYAAAAVIDAVGDGKDQFENAYTLGLEGEAFTPVLVLDTRPVTGAQDELPESCTDGDTPSNPPFCVGDLVSPQLPDTLCDPEGMVRICNQPQPGVGLFGNGGILGLGWKVGIGGIGVNL